MANDIYIPGNIPFSKLIAFGRVAFDGPSGPINVNIDWPSAPITLIDAAYPSDPFQAQPAPLQRQIANFKYGLISQLNPITGYYIVPPYARYSAPGSSSPFPSPQDAVESTFNGLNVVELQWNFIYIGVRMHNNQSTQLVVSSGDGNNPFAYCRARIDKLELKMTPGSNVFSYVPQLSFTLLSEWANQDSNIISSFLSPSGYPLTDIHVPFGSLQSFGGHSFIDNTHVDDIRIIDGITFGTGQSDPIPISSSVITSYGLDWNTQYTTLPHRPYPVDHFGGSPCPIKAIQAEWDLHFKSDGLHSSYTSIYLQYNTFLSAMRGGNQKGTLVCTDSHGSPGSCLARLKSFPVTLTQLNARSYVAKLTFDILSDWIYPFDSSKTYYNSIFLQ